MRRRDDLAIHNERVKMIATILNAAGLAFFGLGFARPLVDDDVKVTPMVAVFLIVAICAWNAAFMVLGQLEADNGTDKEARR